VTRERLIVFVKSPTPGLVKTRLAESLGVAAACEAYVTLVECLLARLSKLPCVEMRFAPDDRQADIERWLRPGWTARPQGTGDLGDRLARAVGDALDTGARRVVIIGSDCPDILADDIQSAWKALEHHYVVIGPAEDGGYWLIGLSEKRPEVFADIPWSTSKVLEQTLERCRTAGLSFHLLQTRHDVDTPVDWERFLAGQ